jgi:hypothetical protein
MAQSLIPIRYHRWAELFPARGPKEITTMILQTSNNARGRSRSASSQTSQPAQAGPSSGRIPQNQWQRSYEHYCQLAQSNIAGDRVTREQHWQHAEHFLRMMNGSAT